MATFTTHNRPVKMGTSESLSTETAAPYSPTGTGGMWLRTDGTGSMSSSVTGASEVEDGEFLRISTNSTYACVNQASIGDRILQPDSSSGGMDVADAVGTLACYEPLANGAVVDVAARTLNPYNECPMLLNEGVFSTAGSSGTGFGVRRTMYNELSSATVSVIGVGADNPDGREDLAVTNTMTAPSMTYDTDGAGATVIYTLDDMIETEAPTNADTATRGAPVFDGDDQVLGMWVGVSDSGNGVIAKANNIEQVFGGRIITGYRMKALKT